MRLRTTTAITTETIRAKEITGSKTHVISYVSVLKDLGIVMLCTKSNTVETLRFSRLNERNVNLVAFHHLGMQRLSSKATICPDTMMRQVHQRMAVLFFLCRSNQKVINRYILYVKHTLIT